MITIIDAIVSLRPGAQWSIAGDEYASLDWQDEIQTKPTESDVNAEIQRLTNLQPLENCKNKAKTLIAASDWSVLPDVGLANVSDFQAYRGALRALILNPVVDPVWPTEPNPVWS